MSLLAAGNPMDTGDQWCAERLAGLDPASGDVLGLVGSNLSHVSRRPSCGQLLTTRTRRHEVDDKRLELIPCLLGKRGGGQWFLMDER
jgi:hypothetical protein